jgi:hypothetical protein
MEMVGHQAKGVNLPAGAGATLAQGFQKAFAVLIIPEDEFAAGRPGS